MDADGIFRQPGSSQTFLNSASLGYFPLVVFSLTVIILMYELSGDYNQSLIMKKSRSSDKLMAAFLIF